METLKPTLAGKIKIPSIIKFSIARILSTLITLFVVTSGIFAITLLVPADDRARQYVPPRFRYSSPENIRIQLDKIIEEKGMDDPFHEQYFRWLDGIVHGEWGYSPILGRDVFEVITSRASATAELILFTLGAYLPIGLASGALAGWKKENLSGKGYRLAAFISTSIPPFVMGIVFLVIFYVGLNWFSPSRLSTTESIAIRGDDFITFTGLVTIDGLLNGRWDISLDALRHLAMPVLTLGIGQWATLSLVTRSAVIEELGKDYISSAYAKGLSNRRILWIHALGNAIVPGLTISALSAASMVTAVYVVEAVFNWHGISELITMSLGYPSDLYLAMGVVIFSILVVLLIVFFLDILQALVDPRIRDKGGIL